MNPPKITIEVGCFELDFLVDANESKNFTMEFCPPGWNKEFVFIVADLYINVDKCRTLVLSSRQLGNVYALLSRLSDRVKCEQFDAKFELLLQCGALATWIDGYFERLEHGSSYPNDEDNYDYVSTKVIASDNNGMLSFYRSNGKNVIEVMTREKGNGKCNIWLDEIQENNLILQIEDALLYSRSLVYPT